MRTPLLSGDEWIGFQLSEGPCKVGCDYCYERPAALKLLNQAAKEGKLAAPDFSINNAKLADFISKNRAKLGLELSIEEIRHYFDLFNSVGLDRAFLVGSEPTKHPQFETVLDLAKEKKIRLLVYTSGTDLATLNHPAVEFIVLHLNHGFPSDDFMKEIGSLLGKGKKIHFRVNFSASDLRERFLIDSFYSRIAPQYLSSTPLKYSFTTPVSLESGLPYCTPAVLKKTAPQFLSFVEEFKGQYPTVPLYSERPLFPCSFSREEWESYKEKGGFVSKCEMEFVIYPKTGLALCPPSRNLVPGKRIETAEQLVTQITELRKKFRELSQQPSFDACKTCARRIDQSCQGGCGGYKEKLG